MSDFGPQKSPSSVARINAQVRSIKKSMDDIDDKNDLDFFICSRCGVAALESDRSGNTTECIYC